MRIALTTIAVYLGLITGGVLTLSSGLSAAETTIWAAPSGREDAAGKTASAPTSLRRAFRSATEVARNQPDADLQIVLRQGVYRIDAPLTIGREHVPSSGRLTIQAADGERVVISGGRPIRNWSVAADGTWEAALPGDPAAEGPTEFGNTSLAAVRELFVNGQRRPRARHPNTGYARIDTAFPDKRSGFTFHSGEFPQTWTGGGELVFLHDWSISRIPIASVDHAMRRLTAAFPIGCRADHYRIDHFEPHPRFFVENHPAFFDAPGEWLADTTRNVLRYRPLPGESPDRIEAVVPRAAALLIVAGDEAAAVRNIHVRGLHFEHCSWTLPPFGYASGQATAYERREESPTQSARVFIPAAVRFERAEDCSFTAGRIAHTGTSGIAFGSRTRRCRLEDCVIEDISGNGVNLGEDTSRRVHGRAWWQAAPEQAAAELRVAHCRIERCGRQFFGAVGVWAGIAHDLEITANEIARHPYTGVSLGWMWNPTPTPAANNRVTANHIHHVMQVLSDGGGIYTLGRQPGSQLLGNVIHDVPLNAGRAESNGMFLDEGSDQVLIADNVIFNIARSPLRFHKAEHVIVRNNTLVLANKDTPPLRFNNTNPANIQQTANRTPLQKDFDPTTVKYPPTGPRTPHN